MKLIPTTITDTKKDLMIFRFHAIISDKGEYPGNDGIAVMHDLSCGGIQKFNVKQLHIRLFC